MHSVGYGLDADEELRLAQKAGIEKIILVGEDVEDSELAVKMAQTAPGLYATVGVHPHEADKPVSREDLALLLDQPKVVGVGECGLDYWYHHSTKQNQERVLRMQIELAIAHNLPMSIHVRGSKDNPVDAFDDFFRIFDDLKNRGETILGVVHSFSAGQPELEGVLSRSLYVGLNGIATFADSVTQEVINSVPLGSMVLETDTPFLTPVPERGKINAPKYLMHTAEHICKQRGIKFDELAKATSVNAHRLFKLEV